MTRPRTPIFALGRAAPYLRGMVPSAFFNLGGWNYRDVWLDQ